MMVNNEIGVIQDVATLGAICRERGVIFHVDAAQASGKVAIDLARAAGRSDVAVRAQDVRSQRDWRAVRAQETARTP